MAGLPTPRQLRASSHASIYDLLSACTQVDTPSGDAPSQQNNKRWRFRTVQEFLDTLRRWPECEDVVVAVPRHALEPTARLNPYDLVLVSPQLNKQVVTVLIAFCEEALAYSLDGDLPA